jgi:hypothetical protein
MLGGVRGVPEQSGPLSRTALLSDAAAFGHDQKTASDERILEHGRLRNNQPRILEHGIRSRHFEHPIQPRIVTLAFGLIGDSLHR